MTPDQSAAWFAMPRRHLNTVNELDNVLAQAKSERWTHLAFWSNPRRIWVPWYRGPDPGMSYDRHAELVQNGWPPDRYFFLDFPFDAVGKLCELTFLEQLDIVADIGEDAAPALTNLTNLTYLGLYNSMVGPKGAAALSTLTNLRSLDLSGNGIGDGGVRALSKLLNIESLNLSGNEIMGPGLEALLNLPKLRSLDVSFNSDEEDATEYLSPWICQLINLTHLKLDESDITDHGAILLTSLASLSTLSIARNSISEVGVAALSNLAELNYLNLANNPLHRLSPDRGPCTARALASLKNLRHLNVADRRIQDKGAASLAALTALKSLNVRANDLGDEGVAALANLRELEILDLQNNHITGEGIDALGKLPKLVWLDLSRNVTITGRHILGLAGLPAGFSLKKLGLKDTNTPELPAELQLMGDAQEVFRALRDGAPLSEVKLAILGNELVGKSNIARRMVALNCTPKELADLSERAIDPDFTETPNNTHDFDIIDWSMTIPWPCDLMHRLVNVRMLDFAGQAITHATHQFFLTSRCIYLLVVDGTKTVKENAVEYWLRLIWHYAGKSPVIVVVNKADLPEVINIQELGRLVESLARLHDVEIPEIARGVSAKTLCRLDELKDTIKSRIERMSTLNQRVPRDFHNLRAWYEDSKNFQRYETIKAFDARCREAPFCIKEPTRRRTYLRLLHEFATVFHWGDATDEDEMDDSAVGACRPNGAQPPRDRWLGRYLFQPAWLKRRVYEIIRNNEWIEQQQGILSVNRIKVQWQRKGLSIGDEQSELDEVYTVLAAMQRFELCFPLENGLGWLLPACLSEMPIAMPGWKARSKIIGRFRSITSSVIHRLIVRLHRHGMLAEGIAYWRYGCVARDRRGTAHARIALKEEERTITIEIDSDDECGRELAVQIKAEIIAIHTGGAAVTAEEAINWDWMNKPGESNKSHQKTVTTSKTFDINSIDLRALKSESLQTIKAYMWGMGKIKGFATMELPEKLDALLNSEFDAEDEDEDELPFDKAQLPSPKRRPGENDKSALKRAADTFRSRLNKLGISQNSAVPAVYFDIWGSHRGT